MTVERLFAFWVVVGLIGAGASASAELVRPSEHRAGFTVRVGDETIPYRRFSLFVLPRESLEIGIVERARRAGSRLKASWPGLEQMSGGFWRGRAPAEPGLHSVGIESGGERIDLNVFVMVPASEVRRERLRGYRIGSYPDKPYRGLSVYQPPRGFVEVTPENQHLPLSPHFTLGQFLCKQDGGYPKFVVLRERMLLTLEHLLALVNAHGLRADSFFVMSGYRTPSYNAAIGNVRYSRHQYGDAADIFIDENPRDGVMDDLNGDGRIDAQDAHFLYDIIDAQSRQEVEDYRPLMGGLGSYSATEAHGPFVHVDVRGFKARWGR